MQSQNKTQLNIQPIEFPLKNEAGSEEEIFPNMV